MCYWYALKLEIRLASKHVIRVHGYFGLRGEQRPGCVTCGGVLRIYEDFYEDTLVTRKLFFVVVLGTVYHILLKFTADDKKMTRMTGSKYGCEVRHVYLTAPCGLLIKVEGIIQTFAVRIPTSTSGVRTLK